MKLDKDKIFLLRARNCLTVSQLAAKAKVSCREISKSSDIGAVSAGKIAKALNVDVTEIIIKED